MNQSNTTTAAAASTPPVSRIQRYAWVILLVAYLASVAAPLSQNKVPPIMPILMDAFHINLGQAGLLMSVFGITGFLLALPASFILQKWGFKVTGIIALVGLATGSALGALSASMGLLLTSRVLEGVGMGLIAVVAPAAIAAWFPADRQGMPMGLWATWVPVGNLVMLVLAPALATAYGWQSVWWLAAAISLVVLVLYGWLMCPPPSLTEDIVAHDNVSLLRALSNRDIWLLALSFCSFNFIFMPLATFYPTFLAEVRGYSLAQASLIASLSIAVVLISAPLAGWFSDRIGSRRLVLTIPLLVIGAMMFLPFRIEGWQIYTFLVLLGLVAGAVPTATFAAAPEVMPSPRLAGLGLAVVMMGQNLGMFVSPVLFGELVEAIGWNAAAIWLIPVALLGALAAHFVRVR